MTAKKMADIFFGKFSELISSYNFSNENEKNIKNKNQKELKTKDKNILNNKITIYIYVIVLLIIIGYLII